MNYNKILTAPNYGKGYRDESQGVSNKVLNCTSGLDPFAQAAGTLVVTQDCIDAITANQIDRQMMKQFESQLNLQGGLFELPAGEVRSAIGLSWRKNTYTFTPDSLRESDYTADTSAGQFGVGFVDGSVAVKEVYAELLIPLLKDLPGIRSLELELGGRYSQYTTGQDVPTYKAQLSWAPLDWLRVRGGYNRAERTPNIAELYTTTTVSSQLTGVGTRSVCDQRRRRRCRSRTSRTIRIARSCRRCARIRSTPGAARARRPSMPIPTTSFRSAACSRSRAIRI